MSFVDIVFASILANNLLFFHFLGLGEFLGGDSRGIARRTAILGVLLVVVAAIYWVPDHFLLQPLHLEFLRTIVLFAALWAVTMIWTAIQADGPQPRELVVHSLLVGGVLLVGGSSPDWVEVLTASVAVAVGYGGALVLLGSVFRRLSRETISPLVQGLPLKLITLGLVWLVLQGLGFAFVGKVS